jgi:predicted house-cleaning noncanonical NTP pyrophosphatase (MazG superfamily)
MPSITLTFTQENIDRIRGAYERMQGRDPETDPVTKEEVKQKLIALLRNDIREFEEAEILEEAKALARTYVEPEID